MKTNRKTETTWKCVRRVADYCHAILKTTNGEVSTLAHLKPLESNSRAQYNTVPLLR